MSKQVKISFICNQDDVQTYAALLLSEVKGFTVSSVLGVGANGSGASNGVVIPAPPPVQKVAPRTTRKKGGSKASETLPGQVILKVFSQPNGKVVAYGGDLAAALQKEGYAPNGWCSIALKLVNEGRLVRRARGAYRLPTDQEQLEINHRRMQGILT